MWMSHFSSPVVSSEQSWPKQLRQDGYIMDFSMAKQTRWNKTVYHRFSFTLHSCRKLQVVDTTETKLAVQRLQLRQFMYSVPQFFPDLMTIKWTQLRQTWLLNWGKLFIHYSVPCHSLSWLDDHKVDAAESDLAMQIMFSVPTRVPIILVEWNSLTSVQL